MDIFIELGLVGGAIAGLALTGLLFGLLALVSVFHKAFNWYRSTALLLVISLLLGSVWFMFQVVVAETPPAPAFSGFAAVCGLAAFALLTRARRYLAPAMRPPGPPPLLDEAELDVSLPADPFA